MNRNAEKLLEKLGRELATKAARRFGPIGWEALGQEIREAFVARELIFHIQTAAHYRNDNEDLAGIATIIRAARAEVTK